jgi:hypothetical protein
MKKIRTIGQAQSYVNDAYPNTGGMYPGRESLKTDNEKLLFDLRHNALHASKLAGKFAALSEKADHNNCVPERIEVVDLLVKMQINILVTANRLGISATALIKLIPEQ